MMRLTEAEMTVAVEMASMVLKRGGVIAYPTETFYGLGVKYDDTAALKKLYSIKRRSWKKAMPLIIGDREMLDVLAASVTETAITLAENFWPGPLTLLLPARQEISELVTARTGKVAVRVPGESFALHLVRSLGFPVTATSANISGMPAADNADDVVRYFGDSLDLIIDCGKTPGGKPSTIVDASEDKVRFLRAGAIPIEAVFAVL